MSEGLTDTELAACACGHPVIDHYGCCEFCDCTRSHEEALRTHVAAREARAAEQAVAPIRRLREEWMFLPVYGQRGEHILDGVERDDLLADLDAALRAAVTRDQP